LHLTADYRLVYGDSEWTFFAIIALAGILIYPVGCPMLYWIVLKRHRHKLYNDATTFAMLGFIYESYVGEFYFWVIVEMCRKLLLTGALLFVGPGSMFQLAFGMVMASFFMALQIKFQPCVTTVHNCLQPLSNCGAMLTLTIAMVKSSDDCKTWLHPARE